MTTFLICTIIWLLSGIVAAYLHLWLCVSCGRTPDPCGTIWIVLLGTGALIALGWVALDLALTEREPKRGFPIACSRCSHRLSLRL